MSQSSRVDGQDVLTVQDARFPGKTIQVRVQPSNIDACVKFSLIRCALSIISIGLVLTDIPRTGLSIDLLKYYPTAGQKGMLMYYGPYAYPVLHLNRSNTADSQAAIEGFLGDSRIEDVEVWPYKFDSLSIPTRALAEQLNVSSYPLCLLYKHHCPKPTLTPDTVFSMLNDLVNAIDERYFKQAFVRHLPIVFQTTSYWVDRLHHVIIGKLGYRVDIRLHSVYRFAVNKSLVAGATLGIDVCEQSSADESHHPLICKIPVPWRCDHPFLGADVQIQISHSIQLRVAAFQQMYPDAHVDLTLITTRSELQSQRNALIPTVFFYSDNTEITTLIRGRVCQTGAACTTIFIDDFRYERATMETTSEEFSGFTSSLRAISQLYVWLRVTLLVFICCRSRLSEAQHREKSRIAKVGVVLMTLSKVPSHTIVYGSWLPIIGYSVAHFTDCGLIHMIGDNFWSSVNGLMSFDFVNYVLVSSIQMRNIWLIALTWKCSVSMYNRLCTSRNDHWMPQNGLIAFRALFIGATSSLTLFSFLRALRFRDCRVLSFLELGRSKGAGNAFHSQPLPKGATDYGYPLDTKVIAFGAAVVIGYVFVARYISRLSRKSTTRSFFCHTFYVPLSTGVLFSASSLNAFWYMELSPIQKAADARSDSRRLTSFAQIRSMSSRVLSAVLPIRSDFRRKCETCDFTSTSLHWRAIQGCRRHETLFTIGRRSVETQSMVRLIHIGMFSDPIAFFKLRVLGKQLYLYSLRDRNQVSALSSSPLINAPQIFGVDDHNPAPVFLSPIPLPQRGLQGANTETHSAGDASMEFELIARVNSANVPWTLLVDCG